jgi:hypothetical protein
MTCKEALKYWTLLYTVLEAMDEYMGYTSLLYALPRYTCNVVLQLQVHRLTTKQYLKLPHPHILTLLLSLAPQPSLGLGLLHKIRLNFLEASQQFSFLQSRIVSPTPTPIPEDQASLFIYPRGRVATHFSRLLRHARITVGLFLFPGHHTGNILTQLHQILMPLGSPEHFPKNPCS